MINQLKKIAGISTITLACILPTQAGFAETTNAATNQLTNTTTIVNTTTNDTIKKANDVANNLQNNLKNAVNTANQAADSNAPNSNSQITSTPATQPSNTMQQPPQQNSATKKLLQTQPTQPGATNQQASTLTSKLPVEQANMTDDQLKSWALQAAVAANSFNFSNVDEQLASNAKYFTTTGQQNFITALQKSGNINIIKNEKLVVSSVSTGPTVITNKGIISGRYSWNVQIPLLITYQSANSKFSQHMKTALVIVRSNEDLNHDGVGIAQFVMEMAKSPLSNAHSANTPKQCNIYKKPASAATSNSAINNAAITKTTAPTTPATTTP
jgi:intracellular multiplication protein IcmL